MNQLDPADLADEVCNLIAGQNLGVVIYALLACLNGACSNLPSEHIKDAVKSIRAVADGIEKEGQLIQ